LSETEQLLKKLQEKLGGNLAWGEIHPQHQMLFVQAVNTIIDIASIRKENTNGTNRTN
jgi:hypothetical protein